MAESPSGALRCFRLAEGVGSVDGHQQRLSRAANTALTLAKAQSTVSAPPLVRSGACALAQVTLPESTSTRAGTPFRRRLLVSTPSDPPEATVGACGNSKITPRA